MPATSPKSKHTLTAEQVKKGGKNSKRGPSIKKLFEKYLQADVPATLKKAIEDRSIIQRGQYYKLNKKVFAKKMDEALTLSILNEAMAGEGWAAKLVTEQIDGAAKQKLEHTGAEGGPIETESSIKPNTLKQIEELLYKNQPSEKST